MNASNERRPIIGGVKAELTPPWLRKLDTAVHAERMTPSSIISGANLQDEL
jgi:hypothetical protein